MLDYTKGTIESVGTSVLYLPPYGPNLNPIEMMWSKMKAFLRKLRYDTVELLHSEPAVVEEIRDAMFKLNQRGLLLGKIPLNVEIQTEI